MKNDWQALALSLDRDGYAQLGRVLDDAQRRALIDAYGDAERYRKHVVMERHGFGVGDYKYFAEPLPEFVASMRTAWYALLAPIANTWMERLGSSVRYPANLDAFIERCAQAGQTRPTPLILRYEHGGYNCLHQDLYGEHAFPLQVVVLLSERGVEYEGGEFVLVEQRPRMQSRPIVLTPGCGDAIVFANNERPVRGARGWYRVKIRHGVSQVTWGQRYAIGVIFHNAN